MTNGVFGKDVFKVSRDSVAGWLRKPDLVAVTQLSISRGEDSLASFGKREKSLGAEH